MKLTVFLFFLLVGGKSKIKTMKEGELSDEEDELTTLLDSSWLKKGDL